MFTFLIVFLILFGIGCLIGFVYANIRYGIPTLIWIFKGTVRTIKEGWQEGCQRTEKQLEAKYGKPKPFLTALKEGWQEGWNSAKPRR
ncbi:MAG: hypothetical protein AB1652_01040 [Bacillota bacterium]